MDVPKNQNSNFFTAVPDDLVANYTGGIYYDTTGNVEIEHDISVVGYGHDEATGWDYWIIRNSWGTYWVRLLYYRSILRISIYLELTSPCSDFSSANLFVLN